MRSFSKHVREFLLNEVNKPSPASAIQAIREVLTSLNPSSLRDRNRIHLALEQLGSVRRHVRTLSEEVSSLKEQLTLIEENRNKEQ